MRSYLLILYLSIVDIVVGQFLKSLSDNNLKCFRCGLYTSRDGMISSCSERDTAELIECDSSQQFCMKYVDNGRKREVRACVDKCSELMLGGSGYGEIAYYCCQSTGCNHGPGLRFSFVLTVASVLVTMAIIKRVTSPSGVNG